MANCSYGSNCLGLNVTLEDCTKCKTQKLHHVCQGEYESNFFAGLDLGLAKLCLSCLKERASDNNGTTTQVSQEQPTPKQTQNPKQMEGMEHTSTPEEHSQRSKVSPSTTARNKKKKKHATSKRCQKGARVKVKRKDFYHVLTDDDQ